MVEIDLQRVLQEIQTTAKKRRLENPELEAEIQRLRQLQPDPKFSDARVFELAVNLRKANEQHHPGEIPAGTRLAWLKRTILRLITPFTRSQLEFNASAVRVLNRLSELVEEHQKQMERQASDMAALRQENERFAELIRTYNSFLHEDQRQEAIKKLADIYRTVQHPEIQVTAERNRRLLSGDASSFSGMDYFAFEARFRGSEAEIKERLRKYVNYFEHSEPVLDLACGRGEFLELLYEAGVEANGVDINADMISRCAAKGVKAACEDAFSYLEKLEDQALGGIFAAQLIEHFDSEALNRLVALSFLKLKIGGVLILETINPASLFVHAHSLYLDPSHVRPYHPLGLEFLIRNFGFSRTEVRFGSPVEDNRKIPSVHWPQAGEFNAALARLNDLVYGPQDYAVIAHK